MSFEVTEEVYCVANKPHRKVRILKILKMPECKIIGEKRTFYEE